MMNRIKFHARLGWLLASFTVGLWVFTGTGCSERRSGRLNAPPQGISSEPNDLQDDYISMHDNALLADMSMSSVHFVPHSAELSGLGARRLKRYVTILKIYGGTLNYCDTEYDRLLTDARLESIDNYLLASGLAEDQYEVKLGIAGGTGLRASEAMAIRAGSTISAEEGEGGDEDSESTGDLMSAMGGE
ncbi:MAG: hypothetical protein ACYTF1_04265 [Planctomycetota bacterium]